ncbi:MAG: hypothetical protein CVU96_03715 [Firmicutes bacterium HGW-Firmicutes-20]|jgi:hypothetical protein|nr:MAG: hypothetical protein CVU96_03715 [Firmicutes bacterium HGW-Firmicutes-20]PKM70241.1 MAG: hypothetical protein CVU94_00065 [Firmicutes bacterium HGW-Firmicutes-19]
MSESISAIIDGIFWSFGVILVYSFIKVSEYIAKNFSVDNGVLDTAFRFFVTSIIIGFLISGFMYEDFDLDAIRLFTTISTSYFGIAMISIIDKDSSNL